MGSRRRSLLAAAARPPRVSGGETTVIVDTASELTWVQCAPCDSCHDQQEPLFDPSSSPSYAAVPCDSPSCDALRVATGMSGPPSPACGGAAGRPACSYTLSYRDGSYSRGVLARDNLSLAGEAIDGFVFGCGSSNQGAPFGGASGLMALGRSQLSLARRLPQPGLTEPSVTGPARRASRPPPVPARPLTPSRCGPPSRPPPKSRRRLHLRVLPCAAPRAGLGSRGCLLAAATVRPPRHVRPEEGHGRSRGAAGGGVAGGGAANAPGEGGARGRGAAGARGEGGRAAAWRSRRRARPAGALWRRLPHVSG